jgi:hypothetical protein
MTAINIRIVFVDYRRKLTVTRGQGAEPFHGGERQAEPELPTCSTPANRLLTNANARRVPGCELRKR